MVSTKYLGLSLKNPVIAGASGFTGNIKMIFVGADASEIVSTLYKHKPVVIRQMLDTLQKWMESHNFSTIDAFKGLKSQKDSDNPEVFNRLQYMKRYGDLQK